MLTSGACNPVLRPNMGLHGTGLRNLTHLGIVIGAPFHLEITMFCTIDHTVSSSTLTPSRRVACFKACLYA